MLARLRPAVRQEPHAEGLDLVDALTGLRVGLPAGAVDELGNIADAALASELATLGLTDQGLDEPQIRERQRKARAQALALERDERLRELLQFAVQKVPYYRDRASAYDPALPLESLPLMRKADVRANFPTGLLAEHVDLGRGLEDGSLAMAVTSGTTGERLQVVADLDLPSMPERWWTLWGLPPPEAVANTAVFTSPTCLGTQCHLGRSPYEQRLVAGNTLFLNSTADLFSIRRALVEEIAAELARLRPTFLLGNPLYLHLLGRRAFEWGIALPPVPVVLSSYQLLPAASRRAIARYWGARVFDYYAASDLGGCRAGVECARGRMHVRGDHSLIEVLKAPGVPAEQGQIGALAMTTLAARVMPLVRYLIGDLGRFSAPCDCEFADWPCFEVHGRLKDALQLGGRLVSAREVDEVLAQVPGLEFYRCLQTSAEELRIQVIPAPDAPIDVESLVERVRARWGVAAVRVDRCSRLDPEQSLKFRLVESRLPPLGEFG